MGGGRTKATGVLLESGLFETILFFILLGAILMHSAERALLLGDCSNNNDIKIFKLDKHISHLKL